MSAVVENGCLKDKPAAVIETTDERMSSIKQEGRNSISSNKREDDGDLNAAEKKGSKDLVSSLPASTPSPHGLLNHKNTDGSTSQKLQTAVSEQELAQTAVAVSSHVCLLQPDPETPLPRLNCSLVMNGNELVVYGGLVELGHREFTLDDCWTINIHTR